MASEELQNSTQSSAQGSEVPERCGKEMGMGGGVKERSVHTYADLLLV